MGTAGNDGSSIVAWKYTKARKASGAGQVLIPKSHK